MEILVFEKRLPDSTIWGVGDSLYQRYAELATLRLNDRGSGRLSASLIPGVDDSMLHRYGESAIEFFLKKLAVSVIRRVVDSTYQWCGESSTPRIVVSKSRWLRVSLMPRVADSPYRWVGESTTPRSGDTGSHYLKKKNSFASIFSTLNSWSMSLKDQFGQKLARDVI